MNEGTPDFWEWVKNKIREREQQQPLQIEIQLPIPTLPPTPPTSPDRTTGIYEDIDHEIKKEILYM